MATLDFESRIVKESGGLLVAGLDEAGRGALAGPVVAAAVILPPPSAELLQQLSGVNDSKLVSAKTRERLLPIIQERAVACAVGISPATDVDRLGIIAATKQAMQAALDALDPAAQYLLIDGRIRLPRSLLPQESIIRGDSKSLSIAAASILAKVTRDRLMIALDSHYPQYGFARHKGYCTAQHRQALDSHGPSAEHRLTFAPLRATLL